jgi:hypothetical protein
MKRKNRKTNRKIKKNKYRNRKTKRNKYIQQGGLYDEPAKNALRELGLTEETIRILEGENEEGLDKRGLDLTSIWTPHQVRCFRDQLVAKIKECAKDFKSIIDEISDTTKFPKPSNVFKGTLTTDSEKFSYAFRVLKRLTTQPEDFDYYFSQNQRTFESEKNLKEIVNSNFREIQRTEEFLTHLDGEVFITELDDLIHLNNQEKIKYFLNKAIKNLLQPMTHYDDNYKLELIEVAALCGLEAEVPEPENLLVDFDREAAAPRARASRSSIPKIVTKYRKL